LFDVPLSESERGAVEGDCIVPAGASLVPVPCPRAAVVPANKAAIAMDVINRFVIALSALA
jgi:hypothetical protein